MVAQCQYTRLIRSPRGEFQSIGLLARWSTPPITEGNSHNAVTRIFELQRFSKRGRHNDAVTAQQNTVTVTSEEELTT